MSLSHVTYMHESWHTWHVVGGATQRNRKRERREEEEGEKEMVGNKSYSMSDYVSVLPLDALGVHSVCACASWCACGCAWGCA